MEVALNTNDNVRFGFVVIGLIHLQVNLQRVRARGGGDERDEWGEGG